MNRKIMTPFFFFLQWAPWLDGQDWGGTLLYCVGGLMKLIFASPLKTEEYIDYRCLLLFCEEHTKRKAFSFSFIHLFSISPSFLRKEKVHISLFLLEQ